MENYFIRDRRMGLRSIREEDWEVFLYWHDDSKMREKIGGIFPFSRNAFHEICNSPNEDTPPNIWFAACEGDELIGIVGLHNIKYIQRNAELAILIGSYKDRNKGKGRKILQLIEEYAFGMLNLHRLYAYVYEDNECAKNFFEKCLWVREGIMKDASFWNHNFRNVEIWAKLNDDWT